MSLTRIWHGRTPKDKAGKYLQFLLDEGTEEYRSTEGNTMAKVWKKTNADYTDFWTVTEWKDLGAVKQFAGDDYEKAKYYPFDEGMLLEFEENVRHYESYDVSSIKIKNYREQLEKLYHGGNWVDESFIGKLDPLTEDAAFTQPIPRVHSVAEIVWHCIYWRTVTLHRLRGEGNTYRDATAEQLNFLSLDELKTKGWSTIRQELLDTQTELVELLQTQNDAFLQNEYQPGFTFDFLLQGTIQHDYYHLGQVGLVVKMLNKRT
jgi:uncharacterized damage-inducible protein DinB